MKNKNELMVLEKNKKTGKILLIVGISTFVIGLIILIIGFAKYGNSIYNLNINSAYSNFALFLIGGIIHTIGLIIGIVGLVLYIINNKKITEKAKDTYKKVEPVIDDVVTKVGNGIQEAAKDIKNSFNKNKKGE